MIGFIFKVVVAVEVETLVKNSITWEGKIRMILVWKKWEIAKQATAPSAKVLKHNKE